MKARSVATGLTVDERRAHPRATTKSAPIVVWLVLDDGSRQMGVIDDHGEGGACVELNGVVEALTAGDVVGLECKPREERDSVGQPPIPAKGRIAWITGRHMGIEFLAAEA